MPSLGSVPVEDGAYVGMIRGHHVGVYVESLSDGGMAEVMRDTHNVDPLGNETRRVVMTEIVRSRTPAQRGGLESLRPSVFESPIFHRLTQITRP